MSENDNCHYAGTTKVVANVTGGRGLEGVSPWPKWYNTQFVEYAIAVITASRQQAVMFSHLVNTIKNRISDVVRHYRCIHYRKIGQIGQL